MNDIVITLDRVSKNYCLTRRKDETLLSYASRMVSKGKNLPPVHRIDAVVDCSLQVRKGEVVGIIGPNASGKTTLLRLIAGITHPESGSVVVDGKITSLLNLNLGMQHRLTVADNIFLACALLGRTHAQTLKSFESIIAFGELEQYIDMHPYQLSSGMNQRLAFSIAIHTEPEILLLDEVFSAGDISFKQKAKKRMEELICGETTVVMVSHDLEQITSICDRVLWMHKGRIEKEGKPAEVIDAYRATAETGTERQEAVPYSPTVAVNR